VNFFFGPSVHILRVSLRFVEPEVWRRIAVVSTTPVPEFSKLLERTMGWEGHHLHMIDAGGLLFGVPEEEDDYIINEQAATVKHLLLRVGSALRWDYDFGDGWEHDVVVEAIEPLSPTANYPVVLEGERTCPPEDVGGPGGYEHLLRVLGDPADEEHRHLKSWAPKGFDPEAFDITAANKRLRAR
jgi:Plasmid pRiA4b ORF-3-like protein